MGTRIKERRTSHGTCRRIWSALNSGLGPAEPEKQKMEKIKIKNTNVFVKKSPLGISKDRVLNGKARVIQASPWG